MVRLAEIVIDKNKTLIDYLTNTSAVQLMDQFESLKSISDDFLYPASDIFPPSTIDELLESFDYFTPIVNQHFSPDSQTARLLAHVIQYLNNG